MYLSDRLLTIWTYLVGFGLSLLGMAAYVLEWPTLVQLAIPPLLIAVLRGTEIAAKRLRQRR